MPVRRPQRLRPIRLGHDVTGERSALGHVLRRPLRHHLAPLVAGARPRSMIQSAATMSSVLCSMTMTEWPRSTRAFKRLEQLDDVERMKPGGRLVEQEDRVRRRSRAFERGRRPGEEAGQLQSLRLAAGKRRDGLAERQVVQTDVEHRPEP